MAAETENKEVEPLKFTFEKVEYEVPQLTECDLDEWMLVYKYAQVTLGDTVPCEDPSEEEERRTKLSQPALWKALFHIAYRRANPKKSDAAIEAVIGKIDYLEAMASFAEQMPDEEEENPTSASEQERSSGRNSASSTAPTSLASLPHSATPEDKLAPTGTSG